MADTGYAVVALDDLPWTRHHEGTAWATLTAPLGATETQVDAVRFGSDDAVELAAEPEQLLVPLEGSVTIEGEATELDPPGLSVVPGGTSITLRADQSSTALVISVPVESEPDATPAVVDLETVEFVVPETSDVATAFLTGPLGCVGMKVNARRLEPGQVVPYHTEGTQEELFVPVSGPASLLVDDQSHSMGTGSVARVAPDVPRSAVNEGDEAALWVMVGAPPTGGPTDWDPGAEILD